MAESVMLHSSVIRGEMPFEIHGGMEHPHDLKQIRFRPEKNHVFALGGDPATRKKIRPQPIAGGIKTDGVKLRPNPVQVAVLLFSTPGFQRVNADRDRRSSKAAWVKASFMALPEPRP